MTNNLTSDKTFNLGMPVSVLLFLELCIFWIRQVILFGTKLKKMEKINCLLEINL